MRVLGLVSTQILSLRRAASTAAVLSVVLSGLNACKGGGFDILVDPSKIASSSNTGSGTGSAPFDTQYLDNSIVTASATTVISGNTVALTLTVKDGTGTQLTSGGLNVMFVYLGGASTGTIGLTVDHNDGTYTAVFTGVTSGSATTIRATISGGFVTTTPPSLQVLPGAPSLSTSASVVSLTTIPIGGTSAVTFYLKDSNNNLVTGGGYGITLFSQSGTSVGSFGSVVDNLNGTYSATFTGSGAGSPILVLGKVNGSSVTSTLPSIRVIVPNPPVLGTLSDLTLPSANAVVGSAISVDAINTDTNSDNGMTYACGYDKVIDGAVATMGNCGGIAGLTFSTSSGTLNWTPTTSNWGAYEFKITGTNFSGSSSQVFVIDVRQNYTLTNLEASLEGDFAALTKPALNSPLRTVWQNIFTTGATYDAYLTGFAGSPWVGNGANVAYTDPYALSFNGSGQRVDLGFSTGNAMAAWIAPANIAGTANGSIIATLGGESGTGMVIRQSESANGKIELRMGATPSYASAIKSNGLEPFGRPTSDFYFWYRLNESSGTTISDSSGVGASANAQYLVGGTPTTPAGIGQAGVLAGDPSLSVKFDGATEYAVSALSINNPVNFSLEAWIKTSNTYLNGGKILGFGNSSNGTSGSYDRHMYMDNTGRIVFGVYPGNICVVATTSAANDGNWHHVVATYDSSGGAGAQVMSIYLDGVQEDIKGAVGYPQNFTGYWHIGQDNMGGWTGGTFGCTGSTGGSRTVGSSPSQFFAGSMDEIAAYKVVLTPAEVLRHYKAGVKNCQSATTFANNVWKHVGAVYDTGTGNATLYVNGVSECSVNYGTGNTASTALTLGATQTGIFGWNGRLGDFKLFSDGDITTIQSVYNNTKQRFP